MKNLLPIIALMLMLRPSNSSAQLSDGSIAPYFTLTDIDGNTWSLSQLTASGKEVILMFGAAWSLSDFEYLQSNALQNYYSSYGPDGTNEVMVLYIEVDESTTVDDLYGNTGNSAGDLTAITNFPLIHDETGLLSEYQIAYYPTIYRVCSTGNLHEIGQMTEGQLADANLNQCFNFYTDVNPKLESLSLELDCQNVNASVVLHSYGMLPLTNCSIHVSTTSGYDQTIEWTGNLTQNQQETINLGNFNAIVPDILSVEITSADDITEEPQTAQLNVSAGATSHIQIDILTDEYPEEIFWYIMNYSNENIVESPPYSEDNTQHIHDYYLDSEECYIFYLVDTYGDGLAWPGSLSGHIHVNAVDSDGDLIPIYSYNGDYPYSAEMVGFEVTEIVPMSISGHVYHDSNENAYAEASESGIGGIEVHLDNLITYTDENGNFIFNNVDNTFSEISIVYDSELYPSPTTATSYSLDGVNVATFNFGLSSNDPNINLDFTYTEPWFFCGFDGYIWFTALNEGNQIANGTITLTLDPLLTYQNANILPSAINDNVYTWEINDLGLGENIFYCLYIENPGFEFMGQEIINSISLTTYDADGNVMGTDEGTYPTTLLCSYDPNDKAGIPTGETEAHYIPNGTNLEYLIRFQNTGNYQAFNIHVLDMIDTDLDLSTLQILGTSHYCQPTINTETREVDFFFPDIMLPDSTSNEQESHGFIRYSISPLPDLSELSTIENTGYIYFDFNPAVITNTTLHTISDLFFGVQETQQLPISIFPNPASHSATVHIPANVSNYDINVIDIQGRTVLQSKNNFGQTTNIEFEQLAAGSYQVEIIHDGHRAFKPAKLVIAK